MQHIEHHYRQPKSKPSFWLLHCGGWLFYVIIFTLDNAVFMGQYNTQGWQIFWPLLASGCIAAIITLPLRYLYQRCWPLSDLAKVTTIITLSLLAAAIWTPLKNVILWWAQGGLTEKGWGEIKWQYFFISSSYAFFMILVWSSLYFGINYHYRLMSEQQKYLKAARLSHSAQIKMLRYQINPHFLFNTLNAISTLVLTNARDKANGMIIRLSTFLRFSLDNDPESKVRLYEELKALMLYLEIEKARFEDRLSIKLNIDLAAENALVPGLLLQPLVENAIKHAIAHMRSGGCISISAQTKQQRLHLTITDNGPLTTLTEHINTNGVGLRNIKERLALLYGEQQSFTFSVNSPHGFKVSIILPLQE